MPSELSISALNDGAFRSVRVNELGERRHGPTVWVASFSSKYVIGLHLLVRSLWQAFYVVIAGAVADHFFPKQRARQHPVVNMGNGELARLPDMRGIVISVLAF